MPRLVLIPLAFVLGAFTGFLSNILTVRFANGMQIFRKRLLTELFYGALAVVSALFCGYTFGAVLFFLISVDLLLISVIDIKYMIIPDALVAVLATLSVLSWIFWNVYDIGAASRVLGIFVLSVPMLALTFFIPDAFGAGDIKLISACGLLLGTELTLLTGFIAVLLGGIMGVYIKYIKKDAEISHISFGQYICIGVFISLLYGDEILRINATFLMY